jgi:hypothetical protein
MERQATLTSLLFCTAHKTHLLPIHRIPTREAYPYTTSFDLYVSSSDLGRSRRKMIHPAAYPTDVNAEEFNNHD